MPKAEYQSDCRDKQLTTAVFGTGPLTRQSDTLPLEISAGTNRLCSTAAWYLNCRLAFVAWGCSRRSETADFALGAATWRTGRNIRVVFDSGHSLQNMTSSTTQEVYITYCTVFRVGLSHGLCTENLVKFGHMIFEIWVNRQTRKETYRHADGNTLPTWISITVLTE